MLNCVNALEHMPVTEQAGLVVTEEKAHHDSCEDNFLFTIIIIFLYIFYVKVTELLFGGIT